MTDTLTALTTRGKAELTEAEQLILEEAGQDETAFDLQPTRVKIAPGGIGQFQMGDDTVKTFKAIVALSQKIRGYWPEQGTGQPPICSSPDGINGIFVEPEGERFTAATGARQPHPGIVALTEGQPLRELYDCSTCPMNQWGSEHQRGGGGKGRACKEMRRLLLLIEGWSMPAIMSLPPTSIRAFDNYASALKSKKSAYFAVWTKFALDSAKAAGGETYNIVQLSQDGAIEETDNLRMVKEIRDQYREYVSAAPVEATEYDTTPVEGAAVEDDAELDPF